MSLDSRVRDEIEHAISCNRIPGIQYAAIDAQGIRLEYQSGYSDMERGKLVSPATTFMASSSTKVITAAAVMQLVEQRKIRLDDPLTKHFASHPYGDQVTIRHLLCQTSGIPNPLPLKWLHLSGDHASFDENRSLQETMRRHPRRTFTPGARYSYSNIGYWLLGKAIESASGRSYDRFLRECIFEPLNIAPSGASLEIPDPAVHATGYQRRSLVGLTLYLLMDRRFLGKTVKGHMSLLPVYMNGPAYGGLICTATGFALFLQDFLKPQSRLLSSATRDLLFTQQRTSDGKEIRMTLGWRIGRLDNELYYGKPGGGPGFRSNVRIYPRLGLGVAWLANETGISEPQMNALSDSADRHWLNR